MERKWIASSITTHYGCTSIPYHLFSLLISWLEVTVSEKYTRMLVSFILHIASHTLRVLPRSSFFVAQPLRGVRSERKKGMRLRGRTWEGTDMTQLQGQDSSFLAHHRRSVPSVPFTSLSPLFLVTRRAPTERTVRRVKKENKRWKRHREGKEGPLLTSLITLYTRATGRSEAGERVAWARTVGRWDTKRLTIWLLVLRLVSRLSSCLTSSVPSLIIHSATLLSWFDRNRRCKEKHEGWRPTLPIAKETVISSENNVGLHRLYLLHV